MIEYWQNLSERERKLLSAGGILVFIAVLYWGVWSPVADSLEAQQTAVESQQRQLGWMQQQAAEVVQLRSRGSRTKSSGSLSAVVNRTARELGITLSRIQPQGTSLQVWIDDVPYNQLINWLGTLRSQQGITAASLDLNATDTAGQVKVRRLLLTRG